MDHVAGIGVLHGLAVNDRLNVKLSGIADGIGRCKARTDGRKGVKTLAPAPLAAAHFQLPIARADIVSAGVACDVVEGSFAGNVFTFLPDDGNQLALVIDLSALCTHGNANRLAGILNCVGTFCEYHRIFGDSHADFIGMAAIILADAPDHRGGHGRQDSANLRGVAGHTKTIERITFDTQMGAPLLGGEVNLSRWIFVADDSHACLKPLHLSKSDPF